VLARTATAAAGPGAPEDVGVAALRAGIAAATAGGGTRVRLARVPWAGEDGPASAVARDPGPGRATSATSAPAPAPTRTETRQRVAPIPIDPAEPAEHDGAAVPAPRRAASDTREVAEMLAALPRAVAATRSPAALARVADVRPLTAAPSAPPAAPRLSRAKNAMAGAAQAPAPKPGRSPGRDDDDDRDIDALYDRLAARLRADLLDDRERRGDHLGRWPG
jgi:hypothetical protein